MATMPALLYLVAAIAFIMALRGLSSPESARTGVLYGMLGMAIAIVTTFSLDVVDANITPLLGIALGGMVGAGIAKKVEMTALPQLMAAFHSLVGLAAVFIATAALYNPIAYGIGSRGAIALTSLVEMSLGAAIGAITFMGSIIAFGKLQGLISGKPLTFAGQHMLNAALGGAMLVLILAFCATEWNFVFFAIVAVALVLGITLIVPIGGADMPVIVSMLNSYSGWAAAGIGFTLQNPLLIIVGALVGASGAILSYIMCKGMNRSFINVLLGGFGGDAADSGAAAASGDRPVKIGSAEDAAFILKNAASVIIVPGYGMAVAQAQHALREMADTLKKEGVQVRYAIHPVAGRMPGHMNVLLAEANVPYDDVLELDDINRDFGQTDVAFVIGANDITNPAAKNDPKSPIYGMPVLDVEKAKTVLFVKRSLGTGYAGVDNPLFFNENTMMLLGDAKKMSEDIIKALEQ
ncbi:MAG: NAD(P)(+) transhydrogenase (Re/Si-specific) subunit beta [Rhodospirillales bacterium]|nr:NAD(P)(+) transhydrogenase (Re/Si-specific) subunit beta [Rhodospirillales bacterium]USO08221.1 MAG: NAD(P)(+) transhydrogenase (Re/Si-specific) subunit beta [Rhodospirillales bacterium]